MDELNPIEPAPSEGFPAEWRIVSVKSRVDSLNQAELRSEIEALRAQGHKQIALDLRSNRFMGLPSLQLCVEVARGLAEVGGLFALISCPEKTKRHFEIYGSLNHIRLVRSPDALKNLVPAPAKAAQPPESTAS